MNRRLVLALALAFSSGCPDEDGGAANLAAPPVATAQGAGASVPLPKLLASVGGVTLPSAPPPASWSAAWKLAEGKRWSYDYAHRIDVGGASAAGSTAQSAKLSGTMTVTATSPVRADVTLSGVKGVMTMTDLATGQPVSEERAMPDHPQPGLLDLAPDAPPSPDPLLSTLLRPPSGPMKPGDVATRKISVPVTSSGKELWAHGEVTWTLRGFAKCGEHTCARFDQDLAVGQVEKPPGIEGEVAVETRAIGWSLFDLDDGSLHSHQSATRMRLFADLVAPPGASEQEKMAVQLGKMDMTQEHLHDIKRR